MQVSNIFSKNQITGITQAKHTTKATVAQANPSTFDRVTISDAAKIAYQNSKQSAAAAPKADTFARAALSQEDKDLEAALTHFFNTTHSSTGNIISGDVVIDLGSGKLLPENQRFREEIEAEIKKLLAKNPTAPFAVASPAFLEKLEPLRQKNGVLSAIGDKVVITDELLEKGSSFLVEKEMQWQQENGWNNSLQSRFQSALNGSGDIASNRMSEEERLRKIEEEMKKKSGAAS